MRLGGGVHLTYCTNIHAGETWPEVRANLERHVVAVKARVCPDRAFGVGLRLSAQAADALAAPEVLAELKAFLAAHDLYVFTINGFPYGAFHGTRVKENVYRPDWFDNERIEYTNRLADLLAALLPPGTPGTISTVPGCFRWREGLAAYAAALARRFVIGPGGVGTSKLVIEQAPLRGKLIGVLAHRIVPAVAHLVEVERRTGAVITLALEPEPACVIETLSEAATFFADEMFGRVAIDALMKRTGLGRAAAEAAARRHVGVCLDACHAAVEYEHLAAEVGALRGAGIQIAKIQLSAGLRVAPVDAAARAALVPFAEGVYLHQVVARTGGALRRYVDLPDALADPTPADEWRIHFHVPIVRTELGPFVGTQGFLAELLAEQRRAPISTHLEVETYTWDVLPAKYRGEPVDDAIARELRWVMERLQP